MEFIKKNKVIFIVAALILLFVVSILITPKDENYVIDNPTVTEWMAKAKEDKYTMVTLGQTTCSHCLNFRPVAERFAKKYNIDWYWIDVDVNITQEDYELISTTFTDFQGTPYTAIMKNGEILDKISGEVQYNDLVEEVSEYVKDLKERE